MNQLIKSMLTILLLSFAATNFAQAQGIIGTWLNEEKIAKVDIYEAKNGKIYGKISWLKEPNKNGKPKLDENNPVASQRSEPIMGLLMLKGFTKTGNNTWENGTIYDPKNGKTYDCKMTLSGNTLSIRGFVGISLIGRTTKWTRSK